MLTSREAFKVGFLGQCAEAGMTPDEILAAVKTARDKLAGIGSVIDNISNKAWDLGKGIGSTAVGWGIPAALIGPPVVGGALGYGLARASDIDDTDVDDITDNELLDEYQRQTDKLHRQREARKYQQLRQRTGRIFPG